MHSVSENNNNNNTAHSVSDFPAPLVSAKECAVKDENMDEIPQEEGDRVVVRHPPLPQVRYTACWFILVGITVIVFSLGIFIPLQLNGFQRVMAPALEQRIGKLMTGSLNEIVAIQAESIRTSRRLQQQIAVINVTFSTPYEGIQALNETLWATLGPQIALTTSPIGLQLGIIGPTPSSFPDQGPIGNGRTCASWCRGPNDPNYTSVGVFAIHRAVYPTGEVNYRHVYPTAPNITHNNTNIMSVYNVSLREEASQVYPSWARNYRQQSKRLTKSHFVVEGLSKLANQQNHTTLYQNGSHFNGIRSDVLVSSSHITEAYYFIANTQQFIHVLTGSPMTMSIIFPISLILERISSSVASINAGPNSHNLVVDGLPRVISYNMDPYGDSRLRNCSLTLEPIDTNSNCGALTASTHPSPFIRDIFARFQPFILSTSYTSATRTTPRHRFVVYDGVTYLLTAQDVTPDLISRFIVVFLVPEANLLAPQRAEVAYLVLLGSAILMLGCLITITVGFGVFSHASRSVELVAAVAECIQTYDINAADTLLAGDVAKQASSSRCGSLMCGGGGSDFLVGQFEDIIKNLRSYQPYLPSSIHVSHSTSTMGDIVHGGQSKSNNLDRTRFRSVTGSYLMVDLGNLPVSTSGVNTSHGSSGCQYHSLTGTFLRDTLDTVQRNWGVIESMSATRVVASFNCWRPVMQHEAVACRCALDLRRVYKERRYPVALDIAVAVTSGQCIAGIGGQNATVKSRVLCGSPLDLLVRLAPLQRMLGASVMTTDATVGGLKAKVSRVLAVPIDVIGPTWLQPGRASAVVCYEVLPQLPSLERVAKLRTESFRALYTRSDPAAAMQALSAITAELSRGVVLYPEARLLVLAAMKRKITPRMEWGWDPCLEGKAFHTHMRKSASNLSPRQTQMGSLTNMSFVSPTLTHSSPRLASHSTSTTTTTATPSVTTTSNDRSIVNGKSKRSSGGSSGGLGEGSHSSSVLKSLLAQYQSVSHLPVPLFTNSTSQFVDSTHSVIVQHMPSPKSVPSTTASVSSFLPGVIDEDSMASSISPIFVPSPPVAVDATAAPRPLDAGSLRRTLSPVFSPSSPLAVESTQKPNRLTMSPLQLPSSPPPLPSLCSSNITCVNKGIIDRDGERYFATNRVLGVGLFGNVYLAIHETGGLVCMKLYPLPPDDVDVAQRLIASLLETVSCSHHNLGSYVSCAISFGHFCVFTEYLAAGPLSAFISSWVPTTSRDMASSPTFIANLSTRIPVVVKFALDIAKGLEYLHTRTPPFVHRDVSPYSVFLTSTGVAKLVDVVEARLLDDPAIRKSMSARAVPWFSAPETAHGSHTEASDVFSLGVTVMYMMLGRVPYGHLEGGDAVYTDMYASEDPSLAPERLPALSGAGELIKVLSLCTSRDPALRPTASQVASSLFTISQ